MMHKQSLLLESGLICKTLFQEATLGILVTERSGNIVLANPYIEKLLGYDNGKLLGTSVAALIPEGIRSRHTKYRENYFQERASRPMGMGRELHARCSDGSLLPVEISLSWFNCDGNELVVAFVADISRRMEAEKEIRQSEERIQLLVEHTPAAVAMFDKDMHYIVVSKRWMEDYKLGNRDIIGLSHYEIFPEINDNWKQLHRRALQGEYLSSSEEPFVRKDGSIDWVRWELAPWYTVTGEVGGVTLFTEVVTERKEAQLQLEELNGNLEDKISENTKELIELLANEKQLNDTKSRLISLVSHEFRTPLTTILSSMSLIEAYSSTGQEEKRQRHINLIKSTVINLTTLLDDFLSMGRLDLGKITLQKEPFLLRAFIEEITEEMHGLLKKGQYITLHCKMEAEIVQDKKILKNTLLNLLSNAIKYSGVDAEIQISVHIADGLVSLAVKDDGIGIAEEEQQNLFKMFFRATNTSHIPGTGLGLNIVKKYLEVMKGNITFQSILNKGTTFTVTIPLN